MIRIACYYTTDEKLHKTFCQLSEKCYYSNLKTIVFTPSETYSQNLDKILWTYSTKHFIPHGTNLDPLQEKQPIYITNNVEEYNSAEIVIFVNATKNSTLEFLSNNYLPKNSTIQKILFIFNNQEQINVNMMQDIFDKTLIKNFSIESFKQSDQGNWIKNNP